MNIYYINLDERTDRNENILKQYQDISNICDIQRVSAIKDTIGGIGCTKSHIKALSLAKDNNLPYVLIVEDDMQIINIENFREKLIEIERYCNDPLFKWDVICLGGVLSHTHNYKRYNSLFIHAKQLQTAIAYIVNASYYDVLLNNFKEALYGLETTNNYDKYACDQYWKSLQEKDNWFCVYPILIKQLPSYSSIENRYANYDVAYYKHITILDDIHNTDCFMIILNCNKYNYKREKQRIGWLSEFTQKTGIQYFHIIGNETISQDYIIDTINNLITVKCPDTYIALPIKSYLAVKAITESYPTMKMILKTDDDMNCNVEHFLLEFDNIKRYDYGGERVEIYKEHMSTYHYPNVPEDKRVPFHMKCTVYCPGRFYFLSKKVCDILVKLRGHFEQQIFEDYAVGFIASKITQHQYFFNVKQIFSDSIIA